MKKSRENEHRISNLKNMLNNINKEESVNNTEDVFAVNDDAEYEEDEELLRYLHHDDEEYKIDDEFIYHPDSDSTSNKDLKDCEIDDEFVYQPDDDNLEKPKINEAYIIKTKLDDNDVSKDSVDGEISESFDNLVNAKIAGTPIIGIASLCIGILLLIGSAILFATASERIVDNVASGERSSVVVLLIIVGILLIMFGAYKVFGFKQLNKLSNSIKNIEKPQEKKETFEKPASKNTPQTKKEDVPQAKERPEEKKGLSQKEIEEIEYEKASLDNESIDEIFSNVEDIDSIKKE